jgi:Fungal fucose-specific lectin
MNNMEVTGLCIDPIAELGNENHGRYDGNLPETLGAEGASIPRDSPNNRHSRYDMRLGSVPESLSGNTPQDPGNRDTIISGQTLNNGSKSPVDAYGQRTSPFIESYFPSIGMGNSQNGTADAHAGNGQARYNSVTAVPQNHQNFPIPIYMPSSPIPQEIKVPSPWLSLFRRRKLWYTIAIVFPISLLAAIITLSILFANLKKDHAAPANDSQLTTLQLTNVTPIVGSSLGAAEIILGTYFSSSADKPQTKVIYDGGGGKICIQEKLGTTWLSGTSCVEGANPKSLTPLTICDWLGGPTGVFINTDGYLSSINNVPENNSWILSSLADQMIAPHPKSKLASLTWLNGTAIWIHYQDTDGQLREYGLNDFRDESWGNGSTGLLGLILEGSSIGVSRYIVDGQEVEEVFFQVNSGAIHSRRFTNTVWETEIYNINGTDTEVPLGASFTATTIPQANGNNMFLVAYIETNGFLTTRSRGMVDVTDLGSFVNPVQVVQGDGNLNAGLAADGSAGVPRVYLLKDQKILMFESDLAMTNWTTTDITS